MIARRRKRARVHSMSLRTFGWLAARQGLYQLLPRPATASDAQFLRLALLRLPLDAVRRMARPYLVANPRREC